MICALVGSLFFAKFKTYSNQNQIKSYAAHLQNVLSMHNFVSWEIFPLSPNDRIRILIIPEDKGRGGLYEKKHIDWHEINIFAITENHAGYNNHNTMQDCFIFDCKYMRLLRHITNWVKRYFKNLVYIS